MKIGLVFDDSLDKTDGVAQYVLITGEWLKAQGHDVHYLVGETKRSDIKSLHSLSRNVKVSFNKNRMTMPMPADKKQLRQLLEREQFDILHIQMPYSPFLAGRIIAAADADTAIVGTFHILPYSQAVHFANRLLGWMQKGSLSRFDKIMATSPPAAKFAKQTYGIDCQVVPLGIPLKRFFSAEPFAKYDDKRTVVFLGRLVERKGCQYLLRALARLKSNGKLGDDVRVVICGDGPLRPQLEQFAKDNNLQSQVEFQGFISEEDKPRYLASADIAIYPSTGGESFGIVLLEAMASARGAVLAGDNPGYSSVIGKRREAIFNPYNIDLLAEKLGNLLSSKKSRDQAQRWQIKHVEQFDIGVVGREIVMVYEQALRNRLH